MARGSGYTIKGPIYIKSHKSGWQFVWSAWRKILSAILDFSNCFCEAAASKSWALAPGARDEDVGVPWR